MKISVGFVFKQAGRYGVRILQAWYNQPDQEESQMLPELEGKVCKTNEIPKVIEAELKRLGVNYSEISLGGWKGDLVRVEQDEDRCECRSEGVGCYLGDGEYFECDDCSDCGCWTCTDH